MKQNPLVEAPQVKVPRQMTRSLARCIHPAYDANPHVEGREFVDQRNFRGQGKSQKSLSRHNPPLTIDEVRELLNKNK